MVLSGALLILGVSLRLGSECCFLLLRLWLALVQAAITRVCGGGCETAPATAADVQALRTEVQLLSARGTQRQAQPQPDTVQRWFHAATFDAPRHDSLATSSTCPSVASADDSSEAPPPPPLPPASQPHRQQRERQQQLLRKLPLLPRAPAAATEAASCAAAAAALALFGSRDGRPLPPEATAAVVGTAAAFASRLSDSGSGSVGGPILTSRRTTSSSCCPPPLEYEASVEQQQALDKCAPDEFLCPLGRCLMLEPVFTPVGFTYHRPHIVDFLRRTGRDPALDAPLAEHHLVPNVNLRDQIQTWLQRQGVQT